MRIFLWLAVSALAIAAAGALFVYSGVYPVAATVQHTAPVYWLLKTVMRESVRRHASEIAVPELSDARRVMQGRALYDAHCVRCHGAPGVAPDSFALGLTPAPANLAHTALDWPPAD